MKSAVLVAIITLIVGCTENTVNFPTNDTDTNFCAQDVKTCSDGTVLTRNANKGCAFDACPFDKQYILPKDSCAANPFNCTDGYEYFEDDQGCGCVTP